LRAAHVYVVAVVEYVGGGGGLCLLCDACVMITCVAPACDRYVKEWKDGSRGEEKSFGKKWKPSKAIVCDVWRCRHWLLVFVLLICCDNGA